VIRIVAALALALGLAGCASPPKPPPPPVLDLSIQAGADQNPETDGHPASVAVRLYQLGATGTFDGADVYALMNGDAAVLGADMIGSETLLVSPGQSLKVHRQLKPGAQFLGVAVLFRDIDHATWRATAPLAPSGPTTLTLKTAKLTMSLSP
jgi:type VI secretion system protein VasD